MAKSESKFVRVNVPKSWLLQLSNFMALPGRTNVCLKVIWMMLVISFFSREQICGVSIESTGYVCVTRASGLIGFYC